MNITNVAQNEQLNMIASILDYLEQKRGQASVYYSCSIGPSACSNCKEFDKLSRETRIILQTRLSVIDQYILLEIIRYLWTRDWRTFRMCDTYEKLRDHAEQNYHRMTYEDTLPMVRKQGIRWADEGSHKDQDQIIYTIADIQKIIFHLLLWNGQ
jgi:hypothetical protein